MFKGEASIRHKSGAYTLVREHFMPDRNEAIGHKMRSGARFYFFSSFTAMEYRPGPT